MRKPKFLLTMEANARRRRSLLLVRLLGASRNPCTVLDVGGTIEYWRTVEVPAGLVERIVLLNTFEQQATAPFEAVVGDARDLSRFEDKQFDVVFSNSVLGHVGSFEDQCRAASEIRRVGRHYFVQTPNHGFPIDWRTLIPFFHFLPVRAQAWCFERFAVGAYGRASCSAEAWSLASRVRNIRGTELGQLFPSATIVKERVLGFTKSFMVHNFPSRLHSAVAVLWPIRESSVMACCCIVDCCLLA
jgi:SAM-dependent methyltransferase